MIADFGLGQHGADAVPSRPILAGIEAENSLAPTDRMALIFAVASLGQTMSTA